ncbi:MAG TPA: sigma-70 family RNA polymerase sigma factor [Acidobacteriota bacterium]|nr:sigma-70 family RNA polymerase sigma factor [Acidobacteriota bacterium]
METVDATFTMKAPAMASSQDIIELYERYYTVVYHAALRVTGNAADAEDALQTVYLRFLKQEDRPRLEPSPEAYFRRAATNAAIDILRRKAGHGEMLLDEKDPLNAKESAPLLKLQLRRAIARLPHDDAALFLLRYVEGLSNGELAEMFAQEKNNITVRLHRIRQALMVEMRR